MKAATATVDMTNDVIDPINDLISSLRIGNPAQYRNLCVYPLQSKGATRHAAYFVLDDALATNQFRITETSEHGSVPRLLAINNTGSPVFLLDGEELVGAKQNRVLNLSVMLAANSTTEIPVSCVEAGRWRTKSHAFEAAERVQFARGRARKMEQVSRSLRAIGAAASDQSAIWEDIAEKSARMRVASPTQAMAALFENSQDDLRKYLDAIPPGDDQVGAVYAFGDCLAGIEVFDSAGTFRRLAGKLLASYALDAIEVTQHGVPPAVEAVGRFLGSVCAATRERTATVGIGAAVRLSANDLVGAALEVADSTVHLAAFPRQTIEGGHQDRGAGRSRLVRSQRRTHRQW